MLGLSPPRIAISRVELLDELGRGAHSVVYRARREGRLYAVKLPLHGETGAKARFLAERFRREAVALARVRHPALPAVMEVGQVERVPYIIMELAAGQTLAERLRYAPLSEAQVIELGRQLADALAAIHRSGLVHRDVKPKNILFDAQTTAVRLVDFGFAASADARSLTDGPAGTPAYMAPEQLAGIRERVDGRADLFSLGCVLFEAVTGSPAFLDEDPVSVIREHTQRAAAATGKRALSKPFADVIARLLARHPDGRYASAEALRDDLDQLDDPQARPAGRRSQSSVVHLSRAGPVLSLFGRQHELDRLRAAWIDAQGGPGRIVVIRGAAGAGKTRLVQALLDDVSRSGRTALVAACQAYEPRSFSAVRQLVEGYVRVIDRMPGGERLRALARLRTLAGDVAPLLRVLSRDLAHVFEAAPPLPHFEDAEHVFAEALTEFLFKLLREIEPAFVFVDNVHWLDAGSRRVLARLCDRITLTGVLVAFATRTTAAESDKLLTVLPRSAKTELELGRLDDLHAMQVVQAYLGPSKVDAEALRSIANLADGSPLATLELVRTMLDAGVLVPWWGTWKLERAALGQMALPRAAGDILARRVRDLDPMTRTTLQAAAVIGMDFEDDLLPFAAELEEGHVHSALFEARRALLAEAGPRGTHRFIHDSVRETLLDMLSAEERRALHQRIAERLDARGPAPFDSLVADLAIWRSELEPELGPGRDVPDQAFHYAVASHYGGGDIHKTAERVFETNVEAGRLAFRGFDNERALAFFETARRAATLLGIELDAEINLLVAEAGLRTGELEQSLLLFERVIEQTSSVQLQAQALSRIAWIQMQLDAEAAWVALGAAFRKLGQRAPSNSFWGFLAALLSWIWYGLLPTRAATDVGERRRLETIANLHYLAGRLAFQTTSPMRLVQSTLRCVHPARRLGPSDALARSHQMSSFVLTALGWRRAGHRQLERALDIARITQDPVVQAQALQAKCGIDAWAGDIRASLQAGSRVLEDFGHWRELADFCVSAHTLAQIEAVRGRNLDAWRWLEVAIQKVNQHEGAPVALEYLGLAARAALASLGREHEADAILGRLKDPARRAGPQRAMVANTQASEVRPFTDAGRLGPELEAFIANVKKAGYNPRRVHMEMTEYYVHVAHARVHASLRAPKPERASLLEPLRDAARDLRLAARIPLLRAHARVIDAYVAFFSGNESRAERLFADAQRLAEREGAPWVLYAVCRGRAHLLEGQGRDDAAHDQAKLAETLAREHGAAYRVRWIREEFGLRGARGRSMSSSSSPSASASRSALRSRGYLHALLRIAEARADELAPEHQAALVLDEIIQVLRADRGLLLLAARAARSDPVAEVANRLRVIAARDAGFTNASDRDSYDRELAREVLLLGASALASDTALESPRRIGTASDGRRAVIAAPIVVHDAPLGVLYLERASAGGPFTDADGDVLAVFALQVPVALELARSLSMRERAEETLRNAEKLDAVSKLAGGVAHDFNNMLAVILGSTEAMLAGDVGSAEREDVATIRSAAERARDLTRQLMAFARGQYLKPEVIQANDAIRRLEPAFRRLLGPTVELELDLAPELCTIKVDEAQLDQVLTNLAMNAGDAMPNGGRLVIRTSNMTLDDEYASENPTLKGGRYAVLEVADSGEGIDEATRGHIFEPFFTTKGEGSGTGLGLATVYGIVTQSGGQIEVESKVCVGTVFRIFFPRSIEAIASRPPPPGAAIPGGSETILVVDDEALVRDSLRRMLHRLGYHVLLANGGEQALRVVAKHGDHVALVITDVLMPGMNGLELARELNKVSSRFRTLFMSGYTNGVLAERGILRERVDFLQKPISYETLAKRVRSALDA